MPVPEKEFHDYFIASAKTLFILREKVNAAIDQGYTPIGGICLFEGEVLQAMVMKAK